MSDAVLVRREGQVLVLVNNNPAARNAIVPAFYDGLAAGLAQAEADPAIGAVVLAGAGGFFCAGGDLQQLATRRELPPAGRRERIEALHDAIRAIRDCGKPVIAAVEGGAAGAGVSFALALRPARDGARCLLLRGLRQGRLEPGRRRRRLSVEARLAPAAHRAVPHGRAHRRSAARCARRGESPRSTPAVPRPRRSSSRRASREARRARWAASRHCAGRRPTTTSRSSST
jgi:hypothetical protein